MQTVVTWFMCSVLVLLLDLFQDLRQCRPLGSLLKHQLPPPLCDVYTVYRESMDMSNKHSIS